MPKITIIFPQDMQALETIPELQTLRHVLTQMLKTEKMDSIVSYRIKQTHPNYLFAHYRSCPAKISYKKDDGAFRIKKYDNIHHHSPKKLIDQLVTRSI